MPSSIYTKPSALALCLVLSACGGGGKSDNSNTAEQAPVEQQNKTENNTATDTSIDTENLDNNNNEQETITESSTDTEGTVDTGEIIVPEGIVDKAIVDAGEDQIVATGNKVILNGKINESAFLPIAFIHQIDNWQIISMPDGANTHQTNDGFSDRILEFHSYFEADKEGVYVFSLGFTNDEGIKYTDTVSITLSNELRTKYIEQESQKLKAAQVKWQQFDSQSYLMTTTSQQVDCIGCRDYSFFQTTAYLIENNQVTAASKASANNDEEIQTEPRILPYRSSLGVESETTIEEQLLNIEEQLENNINNISPINFVKYDEEHGYPITESFYNRDIQESDSTDSFSIIPLDQADCTNNPNLFAPIKLNIFDKNTNEMINCDAKVIGKNEIQNNKNIVRIGSFNVHMETWSYCFDDNSILLTPEDLAETITIEKEGYQSKTVTIENTNQDCSLMPIDLDVYLSAE